MSEYQPNQEYVTTIIKAGLIESGSGTLGIECVLSNDVAGEITHTLWLSEKAKARTAEILAEFGITDEDLRGDFFTSGCTALVGQTATITTKMEKYKEQDVLRVQWFHGPQAKPRSAGKPATQAAVSKAKRLFGGAEEPWQ